MMNTPTLSRRTVLLTALGGAAFAPVVRAQTSAITTVAVAGATGRTGRRIVAQALAAGYRVRGLTRNPNGARERYGDAVEWVACDVRNPIDVAAALKGMDAVFCAIGYTEFAGPNGGQFVDYLGVRHLIDTAVAQNAKYFVLVSSGSSGPARDQTKMPLFGYVGYWKTKAEDRLKTSGLPFTIIGPAGLIDRPGGTHAIRAMERQEYIKLPMAKRNVDIGDIATVAIASLHEPVLHGKSLALLNDDGPPDYDWRQDVAALAPEN